MGNSKINNILVPGKYNVSESRKQKGPEQQKNESLDGKSEFSKILQENETAEAPEHGVKLSQHAAKRLHEREIGMDNGEFFKLKEAIQRLKAKGGQESLVVTGKAAYIVDVTKSKVITALDKDKINGNVFTQIDSTVIMD